MCSIGRSLRRVNLAPRRRPVRYLGAAERSPRTIRMRRTRTPTAWLEGNWAPVAAIVALALDTDHHLLQTIPSEAISHPVEWMSGTGSHR